MGGTVLLGFPGQWAHDNRELADHYTTKIGGLPDWPIPLDNWDSDLIRCRACRGKLCLLAQVYAPIASGALKTDERVLLIFCCVMPICGASTLSWRAFRIQKLDKERELSKDAQEEMSSAAPFVSVSNNDWLGNLDDDSDEDIDLEALGKALSEAGNLASNCDKPTHRKREPVSVTKHFPPTRSTRIMDADTPVIPCFYIYTQEDLSSGDVASIGLNVSKLSIQEKQKNYVEEEASEDDTEDSGDGNAEIEGEVYEYDKAFAADRTYLKFMKQLDANPEQCFRYSLGGKPLLATEEAGDPGRCTFCGSLRDYEMQLMPPLIYFLQDVADDCLKQLLSDWNWITLLIYTCSNSCCRLSLGEKSRIRDWVVAEESVIVQSEKSLHESVQLGYFS